MKSLAQIYESADYIKSLIKDIPDTAVILGSGLGTLCDDATIVKEIFYGDIPHFETSTAPGHDGRLVFAQFGEKNVLLMKGRLHYYEGYTFEQTTYPVRVMKVLGVKNLIVTNAAGGINENFSEGDFMLITDHIKLCAENPLRGENISELGPRFNDMCNAYDKELCNIARKSAAEAEIDLKEGVYAYMSGPCFETPAEIRALKVLGADAVGMSTVPEVIVANHMGMRVCGISCITNMAAGITGRPITADEVNETGERVKEQAKMLVKAIINRL